MKLTVMESLIILIMGVTIIIIMFGLSSENVTIGVNGVVEARRIDGFKFVIGENGRPVQLLDANGRGISCGSK